MANKWFSDKSDWIDHYREQLLDWEDELDSWAEYFQVAAIFYIGPISGEVNRRFILSRDYCECVEWLAHVAPKYEDEDTLIYLNTMCSKFSIKDNKLYDEHLREFVKCA